MKWIPNGLSAKTAKTAKGLDRGRFHCRSQIAECRLMGDHEINERHEKKAGIERNGARTRRRKEFWSDHEKGEREFGTTDFHRLLRKNFQTIWVQGRLQAQAVVALRCFGDDHVPKPMSAQARQKVQRT